MKGYKVFTPDWFAENRQFAVGKTYEEDSKSSLYYKGFSFCKNAVDCFRCYTFDPNDKVAEIEAFGEIEIEADGKYHANKIHIIKELTWYEVLFLARIEQEVKE